MEIVRGHALDDAEILAGVCAAASAHACPAAAVVDPLNIAPLLADGGVAYARELWSDTRPLPRALLFPLHGHNHWSFAWLFGGDRGAWVLVHVDSIAEAHTTCVADLVKVLEASGHFGDGIRVVHSPAWKMGAQEYWWECGHYVIAAAGRAARFTAAYGAWHDTELLVENFMDQVKNDFTALRSRIAALME